MTVKDKIDAALRRTFCASLDVAPVPVGYAVSTGFMLPDGDPLSFYVIAEDDGTFVLEDDGLTLPTAIASGLDLKSSVREGLLRGILADEGLHFGTDWTIRSEALSEAEVGAASMRFVSGLIRTRDLTLLSRENVAASFAEDVRQVLAEKLPNDLVIDEEDRSADAGSPDVVLRRRSTGLKAARIYAAGADLRLMDAVVEYQALHLGDAPVIAVVDRRRSRVSERRFNTATNKGLPMAVVDGPDDSWVDRVISLAKPLDAVSLH